MSLIKKLLLVALLMSFLTSSYASSKFPVKGTMRVRVDFWKKVYTEIRTDQAFLHDSKNLKLVYKKFDLKKRGKSRNKQLKRERAKIKASLLSIASKNFKKLNKREKELYKIVGKKPKSYYRKIARRIRFQSGLKDRYYKGLINSYQYLAHIQKVFKRKNLPSELAYLPHVESSFNYNAYSKVGAAGIWQFMRSTARQYKLKVNYVVDERRDVIKATDAAAWFLKDNYRILKSWPLTVTAYNQGAGSIRKASRKLKTKNIATIVDNYKGRNFGFASKNFYATFMATVEISKNPHKYFPKFRKPKKFTYSVIKLDRPYSIQTIKKSLKLSKADLKKYNPSIRSKAYRSNLNLPKNFALHVPYKSRKKLKIYTAKLKNSKYKKPIFKTKKVHTISRGENLYYISKRYKISLNKLIAYNNIENPSKIFPGMKLKIPTRN